MKNAIKTIPVTTAINTTSTGLKLSCQTFPIFEIEIFQYEKKKLKKINKQTNLWQDDSSIQA